MKSNQKKNRRTSNLSQMDHSKEGENFSSAISKFKSVNMGSKINSSNQNADKWKAAQSQIVAMNRVRQNKGSPSSNGLSDKKMTKQDNSQKSISMKIGKSSKLPLQRKQDSQSSKSSHSSLSDSEDKISMSDSIKTSSNNTQSPKNETKITAKEKSETLQKVEKAFIKRLKTGNFASNIFKAQKVNSKSLQAKSKTLIFKKLNEKQSEDSSPSSSCSHQGTLSEENNGNEVEKSIKKRSTQRLDRKNTNNEEYQEQETQGETQFNELMIQLIQKSKRKIFSKDILKFGVEAIIQKNPESQIPYSVEQLQQLQKKTIDLVDLYKENHDCTSKCLNEKIQAATFDFESVRKLRNDIEVSKSTCKTREQDLQRLQNWFQTAISQNIGVFEVHGKELVYDKTSLNIFRYDDRFRKGICWVTEWVWFDRTVICLILIGSICQAIQDRSEGSQNSQQNQILELIMNITTYFFILEATLKIISQGLYKHKNSYLRDGWNIVDFSVVLSSIIEMIVLSYADSAPSLKVLRALRVIRPLRSVKRVPSMRRLVSIMLKSLPELGNTLVFMMFFFTVFGIIGIQTFHGKIYQRCRLTPEPVDNKWEIDPHQSDFICSKNASLNYQTQCKFGSYCGSPLEYPQLNPLIDDPWEDGVILHNTINFNNIFVAVVTIFEALTLEGWSIQMSFLIDAGEHTIAIVFYLLLIAFGSYFILNLILAVIMGSFSKFENQEIDEKIRKDEQIELIKVKQSAIEDAEHIKEPLVNPKNIVIQDDLKSKKETESKSIHDSDENSRESQFSFKGSIKNLKQSMSFNTKKSSPKRSKENKRSKTSQKISDDFAQSPKKSQNVVSQKSSSQQISRTHIEKQKTAFVQPKAQIEISSLDSDKNPFKITASARNIECPGAFSPLVNNPQIQQISQLQHSNLNQQSSIQNNEETFSFDTPTAARNPMTTNIEKPNYKIQMNQNKIGLKIKENYISEDISRAFVKRIQEDVSEQGVTENALLSAKHSNLDISNEDGYENIYEIQMESQDNLQLENLNFDNIIQRRKNKKMGKKINQDNHIDYEGGSPREERSSMFSSELLSSSPSNNSDSDTSKDKQLESAKTKYQNDCHQKMGFCYNFFGGIYFETELFKFFNVVCKSQSFAFVVLITIFINTMSLSLDRYPIDPDENQILETINNYCTWIFVAEMGIKILGLGIKTYAMDSFNQFDATVVIVSVVEFVLQKDKIDEVQDSEENYITIFRGFRLLRVFRLARNWKSFHKMMVKIVQTINDIFTFFVLLLIIVFVFTLLGIEIFNHDLRINEYDQVCEKDDNDPTCQSPRLNFDDFMKGFVTVFVCLIGEDWQLIMHQYVRSHKSRLVPYVYFISIMVIGNLFLMNLFLAILLKNFEDKSQESQEEEAEDDKSKQSKLMTSFENMKSWVKRKLTKNKNQLADVNSNNYVGALKEIQLTQNAQPQTKQTQQGSDLLSKLGKGVIQNKIQGQIKNDLLTLYNKKKTQTKSIQLIDDEKKVNLEGRSLFIFADQNFIRRNLAKLVVHKYFEMFIFGIVIFSAILMIFEDPLTDPEEYYVQIIQIINTVITGIFILELVLKVIVFGLLFNGSLSYLKNGWNILDFFIVGFSIASLIVELQNRDDVHDSTAQNLQILKMLRVLRSIRIITKTEGLQLSVLSLIYSMPGIMNVTVVTMLFFILLGIFFLNMLKGKFHHCIYPVEIEDFIDKTQVKTRLHCFNFGGVWQHQAINFDSIGNAVLALFTMSTTEGWVQFMDNAVDSVGIGLEPQREENLMYQYIFIAYMIFGSLFITNLFIEVVINTFDKEKEKIDRNFKLTHFQKEWIQVQLKCYAETPKTQVNTNSTIRKLCIKVVEYQYFDTFIMTFIVLNAFVLSIVWIDIDPRVIYYTEHIQEILNIIFMIECVLKLIAYRKVFFNSGWNIFDFSVVAGGVLGLLVQNQLSANISVIRILRVCRILRLLKKAKRLYMIFNSFLHTIPAFMNVGGLIMVMIYIFAIVGNRAFAPVKAGEYLNNHRNFETFFGSFLTLIQVMTGEGWFELMGDLQRQNSVIFECQEHPHYEDYKNNNYKTVGCGTDLSPVYFCFYVFFVSLILVNLFIAVTLQGFNDVSREDSCRITDIQLNTFIDVWTELDPDGTGYIHISEAAGLMKQLIEKKCELVPSDVKDLVYDQDLLQGLIEELHLKLYKKFQYYNFHDIMISLSQSYLKQLAEREPEIQEILDDFKNTHNEEADDLDTVIQKIQEIQELNNVKLCKELGKALVKFKNNVLSKIDRFEGNVYTSSMIPVVLRIQKIFRDKKKQRQVLEYQQLIREKNLQRRTKWQPKQLEDDKKPKNDLESLLKDIKTKANTKEYEEVMAQLQHFHGNCDSNKWKHLLDAMNHVKDPNATLRDKVRTLEIVNSKESLMPSNRQHKANSPLEFASNQGNSPTNQNNQDLLNSEQKKELEDLQIIKLRKYKNLGAEDVKKALELYLEQQTLLKTQGDPYSRNGLKNKMSSESNSRQQHEGGLNTHMIENKLGINSIGTVPSQRDSRLISLPDSADPTNNHSNDGGPQQRETLESNNSVGQNRADGPKVEYKVYLMRQKNLKIPAKNSPQAGTK